MNTDPKPRAPVQVRFPVDLEADLKAEAARRQTTVSEIVRRATLLYLREQAAR
jgi:hypothetical protein